MVLFSMFLAALNIFNRFYIMAFIALLIFLFTSNRKLRVNSAVVILGVFALAIIIFNPQANDRILDMIKPFTYVVCYIMGLGLIQHRNYMPADLRQDEKKVSSVIYVMAGGTLLHFLLNWITNMNATNRNTVDIWTEDVLAATGQAVLACLGMAVAIAFLFTRVGKGKKFIAITTLVLVVAYNLILAGRTLFILILVVSMVAFLYICVAEQRKIPRVVIITISLVIVCFILYQVNVFGIKTTIETSNFYMRFYGDTSTQGWDEDIRLDHKLNYLKYVLKYLWGGSNIKNIYGHYAHDLYLDTYDESGVFAFGAIAIYIISSIGRMVKCIRRKAISIETRVLILCTYLVCNIEFWLEPVMQGIPWFLMAYCFIDGAVTYLLVREREIQISTSLYHQ